MTARLVQINSGFVGPNGSRTPADVS